MRDPLRNVSVRYKLAFTFLGVCLLAFGVGGFSCRTLLGSPSSARSSRSCASGRSSTPTALEGDLRRSACARGTSRRTATSARGSRRSDGGHWTARRRAARRPFAAPVAEQAPARARLPEHRPGRRQRGRTCSWPTRRTRAGSPTSPRRPSEGADWFSGLLPRRRTAIGPPSIVLGTPLSGTWRGTASSGRSWCGSTRRRLGSRARSARVDASDELASGLRSEA